MKKIKKSLLMFTALTAIVFNTDCSGQTTKTVDKADPKTETTNYKVTFIELGSVNCIPCKQMQPVLKSVEQKYGTQVKVIFYDVWTPAEAPYAEKYGIQTIPAQIFLDAKGKEYFRHVGFFPEEDVVTVLKMKGVKEK
jgi:thioredoxin 1